MAERFYLNLPLTTGPVELSGPEAHHLAQVSRLATGDAVVLFNGDGKDYVGRVQTVAKRTVAIDVESIRDSRRELSFPLHVAAALPKGDRAQFLVEKLTELGVTRFTPLLCQRSVVQPGAGKMEKLERYVIEASKQCGRSVLMQVETPAEWSRFVRDRPEGQRLLADPGGEAGGWANDGAPITVAVGPEGGFTADEVRLAVEAGWRLVGLGPRILRVETAALALVSRLVLG